MYMFSFLGIGGSPYGVSHPCGVMYVAFLFLCPSSTLFSSMYLPFTFSSLSCIFYLISWVLVLYFAFLSVFLMQYSNNFSIVIYGFMIVSTYAYPLYCFLAVCITVHLHRFGSGFSSFLSFSIGCCPLISNRCSKRSSHVLSLSRHPDAIPYGSRGQGTKLKFSCFSYAVKLPGIKTYNNFLHNSNIPTYLCHPLAPSSLLAPLSYLLSI